MDTESEKPTSWEDESEPQLMLRVNGEDYVKLLPYAYLVEITYEKGGYIRMEYTSCVVEINGAELEELLPLLQTHRVKCLCLGHRIKEIKFSGSPAKEAY